MEPPAPLTGLHHVTAIAGDAQANLHFYAGVLGLRLVKRTVNFDDPATYHFYFGDHHGHPGTILTFFPWKGVPRGRHGAGQTTATAFAVPPRSLVWWAQRLRDHAVEPAPIVERFGQRALPFNDPDGLGLELVEDDAFAQWPAFAKSPIGAAHAVRGLAGVTLTLRDPRPTAVLLIDGLGYRPAGTAGDRQRLVAGGAGDATPGPVIDLLAAPDAPDAGMGRGTVHHIAFRVPDEPTQRAWRDRLADFGLHPTDVLDRRYFKSVYTREPGGVIFEFATDGPGFATDEPLDALGQSIKLPPWLEPSRGRIEAMLPAITLPKHGGAA